MQTSQGHDRDPTAPHWLYADARQRACGPYPADAIVRLFRFGHIRPETPLWREGDDADRARPLRQQRDAFRIDPGGQLQVIPPPAPAEAPAQPQPQAVPQPQPHPPAAPEPAGEASGPARRGWRRPALLAALVLAALAALGVAVQAS